MTYGPSATTTTCASDGQQLTTRSGLTPDPFRPDIANIRHHPDSTWYFFFGVLPGRIIAIITGASTSITLISPSVQHPDTYDTLAFGHHGLLTSGHGNTPFHLRFSFVSICLLGAFPVRSSLLIHFHRSSRYPWPPLCPLADAHSFRRCAISCTSHNATPCYTSYRHSVMHPMHEIKKVTG